MYSSTSIIKRLLDAGADPRARCETNGASPLHYACQKNSVENVKYWLERFPDTDLSEVEKLTGGTCLNWCALFGRGRAGLEIAKLLIKKGANVNHVNSNGMSTLGCATFGEDSNPEMVQLLIDNGADVNYRLKPTSRYWKTIYGTMNFARRCGSKNLIGRHDSQNPKMTPLNMAARNGNAAAAAVLLRAGADADIGNHLGIKPREMCEKFAPFPAFVDVLERKGL
jgi:ankyrin repeat protein